MPIYEYECQKCEKLFEFMQGIKEAPKTKCEECAGKLTKLISASGFILKGGGWYKDLYASAKPSDSAKSESGTSESGKSESGKSESGKSESGKSESSKSDTAKSAKEKSSGGDKSSSSTKSSSSSSNKKAG